MKKKEIINLEYNGSITLKYKDKYIGVYKDEDGKVYAVDVRCPHLGCILSFNKEEYLITISLFSFTKINPIVLFSSLDLILSSK